MKTTDVKSLLSEVMARLTPESTLEDVYEQLALLSDIELSEKQEQKGQVYTHKEVEKRSQEWLK
ncbi:MAG: hypothetical protein GC178_10335 [Flavobacteriales bacterium]|nr:hypothetical protein [Flavobacteriales bacterium]